MPRKDNRNKGLFSMIGSGIRNLDVFGRPVQFKYKNRFESKSVLGGLTTIVLLTGICLYFAILIVRSQDNRAAKVTFMNEKTNIGLDNSRNITLNA